jgi:hypothetical protein
MDSTPLTLSPEQLALIERPLNANIFLEGPAGCGKTTAGVERLLFLMQQGVPGDSILLLVPQRTLAAPYQDALNTPGVVAGGLVARLTVGGLAQRMVELFWPLVARQAGFARPDQPPTFLTLETAQYYMAHLVRPLLDEGLFESVTIDRNRLYSQIIDNLNKAAVVGFPYDQIGERLKSAWGGDAGQVHIYEDAQACAVRFREYCLAHNLLDFSLQIEVFQKYLWPLPLCQDYLTETYRHLIVDNLEEDTPVAHDLLKEWLPDFESAMLIFDQDGGYRRFLGADPQTGYGLKELCAERAVLNQSFVASEEVDNLSFLMGRALTPGMPRPEGKIEPQMGLSALSIGFNHFYPEMLDWVAAQIAHLVIEEGLPPGEIVVLAPFLSDALRFSLANRLVGFQIPVRSHRPSRSLRDEPATQCLLTLARLAHPQWENPPTKFDVAYALLQAVQDMDLVRAQLLVETTYTTRQDQMSLSSFDQIKPGVQERITYRLGGRYEELRLWLAEYAQGPEEEFDHFLSRLFGEVLSQPGYGFHANYPAGEVAANLVESVQKFRWAAKKNLEEEGKSLGREYLEMVQDGVIAAQYIRSWQVQPDNAVLLAPAYTYLISNRPVEAQLWLDVSSRGWFERLYQPLTHPYVLSRNWPAGKVWTDEDEYEAAQGALYSLVIGLIRRCRRRIYLGLSDLGEQGYEQSGPLLHVFQRVLRQAPGEG